VVKQTTTQTDPALAELIAIKRLIVFSLLRSGVSQNHIALALGISQSQVSRMFPGGVGKSAQDSAKAG